MDEAAVTGFEAQPARRTAQGGVSNGRTWLHAALSVLALAFTGYIAADALLWRSPVDLPVVQVGAVALYLLTAWLCIFWRPPSGEAAAAVRSGVSPRRRLPFWAALLVVMVAVIVPNATWLAVGEQGRFEGHGTWSLGAVGSLAAIAVVRRRTVVAWLSVVLASLAAVFWIGVLDALALGVVGSALWVAVAQLMSRLMDRASRDTAELTRAQREASEWLASQEGARRERRTHVQRALLVAGPVLSQTIAEAGHLDADGRLRARVAEATLRDELRGAVLLDDGVRAALAAARERGVTVTVLDEGGLDGAAGDERAAVRAELAAVVASARSERLYIRTSTLADIAVTVVGRSGAAGEEDDVDLWHEVRRPAEESDVDATATGRGADSPGGAAPSADASE